MFFTKFTKCLLFFGFFAFELHAQAPAAYYDGTQNLSGYKLKAKLNSIISEAKVSWNYGDLPTFYEQTDRDLYYENDSSVLDIYSENPTGADPYNYHYDSSDLIAGASVEGLGWNREHVYSQSFFYSNYPMYSDLNFIVPTDARVNQRRSNYPYGKVGSATFTSLNGTKVGPANMPSYTYTVTEPIDEFKGDVARMLLYVAVRYENLMPYFQYSNVPNPMDSLSERALKTWYINLMLQWNQQDPVSQKEIDRNNAVYSIQGNRNPFIDHPEFANAIWTNLSTDTSIPEQPYQVNVDETGAHFIKMSWPYVQDQNVLGYQVYLNDSIYLGSTHQNSFVANHLMPSTSYIISVRSYSNAYVKSPFTYASTVSTAASDTFSSDLFISKSIEGTGNNKAFEITNNTGYTVDLRDYYLNIRQENFGTGSLYWSSNQIQFEGTLAQGQKMVLINPHASFTCFATDSADIESNAPQLQFDGKLALDLRYKSTTIDRLGNSDVSADWGVNKSLYRKASVIDPVALFDTAQWDVYPTDYCEGLGNPQVPTGIAHAGVSKKMYQLYPNPNNGDYIFIEGNNVAQIKSVKIISADGRLLESYVQPFKNSNQLNMPKGYSGLILILIDDVAYPVIIQN